MSRCALTAISLPLALFVGLVSFAGAQNNKPAQQAARELSPRSVDSQSPSLGNAPHSSSQPKADYSKEPFVVEKTLVRYRFENDGTGRKEGTFRIRIQSEVGVQAFGQLRLGYNSANDRLEIGYVRVIKPDGSVITASPDAIQDLTGAVQQIAPVYTDYREKHVTVPGLRPGDVLEGQINTIFQTAIAPGQFWMQQDFNKSSVVLDEQLEVDIPATRAVKVKNKPGVDPKITEENGRRVYRWSGSHLESLFSESDEDKKKKKKKADELPDVQMTTFSSWEEIGRWYSDLEKDRRKPSREVRAKADELTKGLSSDLEKTEALYDYVSQNFRYVSLSLGLARFQPQYAADVLHNQYGDCKDKNTLLAALLEAEGLHSSAVLINPFRKLDPDVPSPSQFNHVITMLPLGKDEIWMDTTTEVAPFRLLASSLRKKQALVIPENSPARLEETPADAPMHDEELTEVTGKVDDSGRFEGLVTYTLRGDAELRQRVAFRRLAAAQWQKYVEGLNKNLGGEVSDIKIGDVTATRQPFVMSYRASKGNFIDWQKKKFELKLPLAAVSLSSVSSDADEESMAPDEASSEEQLKIGPAHQHTYRLTLELAPRFSASIPIPTQLERDYAAYKSTYKWEGKVLTSERILTLRQNELPPSRADDYRAFRRAVLADTAQQVTIESALADNRSIPEGMKVADLIKSGNEARNNGDYVLAVNLLNRAVETEPKHKSAWNDLGLAYLDSRQDDLAVNAFQKQISVNPYHEFAYNNMGRVYLRQRKYEEAEKWFRKQLEVDPLDKYAHGNLGVAFLETKRFADAVPELEKAASLNASDAEAQVRLGRAYLNLDQDDKAMAAFDKALKISANATIWNSIAYDLSLKGTHLDLAQNYAESAISSTAAALRNVSLAQVSQHQLRLSQALPNYWDTLGWIAFAGGDIGKAEKYVSAAWQLNGLAEEADHLGQIYEKKGQKEQAIHLYALALNSRRPELETRGRLAAIAGGDDKVDGVLEKYRGEPEKMRTIAVPNTSKQDGKAEFYLLLSSGSGSDAQVEAAQFISGDEKLKPLTDAIGKLNYHQAVPEATPLKIVRRGTATCALDSECSLVLALPEDVRFTAE